MFGHNLLMLCCFFKSFVRSCNGHVFVNPINRGMGSFVKVVDFEINSSCVCFVPPLKLVVECYLLSPLSSFECARILDCRSRFTVSSALDQRLKNRRSLLSVLAC